MRSLAALTFRKVDRFSGVANVLVKTGKKSLQNQCQPRDPKAIGLVRSYVSERFEITRQGKKLSFTSKILGGKQGLQGFARVPEGPQGSQY